MSDTLLRQWITLRSLPREPLRISTRAIWQKLKDRGYTVTKRTVERDLVSLSSIFSFTCENDNLTAYWFWPKDAVGLDAPTLDPAAALTLLLARDYLQPLMPTSVLALLQPYFTRAASVLEESGGHPLGGWRGRVRGIARGPSLRVPTIDPKVHAAITDALLHGKQIRARYQARTAQTPNEAQLHPLSLVARDGVMYLVATAWSYSEAYQYALHRFVSVEILDEPIVRPNGYDLDRYIQEQDAFAYPKSDKILNLVVEFEAAAMAQLRERPLSDCQLTKDLPNGWVRVSAAVKDTAELRWWLRSYGPSVRIMKPAALRAEFKKEAKTSVQHYELPDY